MDSAQAEKEAEKEIKRRKRERDDSDMRKVLALPEGRRVMWDIMADAQIFREPYSVNALELANRSGRRYIGIGVFEKISRVDPKFHAIMQKEYLGDKVQRDFDKLKMKKDLTDEN